MMTEMENERLKNFINWYSSVQENYLEFSKFVLQKIKGALAERRISIAFSSARAKDLSSLERKCKKTVWDEANEKFILKYDNPQKQITDFAGVRIVAYLKTDVELIKSVIEKLFEIDLQNSGDKIDCLADNEIGYLSMHYVVKLKEVSFDTARFKDFKCEIQVRTILQDAWAQVFHDRQYKGILDDVNYTSEIKRKTNLLAGALELIDDQINDLVFEYDSLNVAMLDELEYQKLLEKEINDKTVALYCKTKSKGRITRYYNADSTIALLKDFDFKYIRDLDNIVQNNFIEAVVQTNQITVVKLIAYILIIYDAQKYFSLATGNTIKSIFKESFDLLNRFINMEQICATQKIRIDKN